MTMKKFKRSKKAALILMVPATTFTLASCVKHPDDEPALVYQTPEQCADSGLSTKEQCEADYQQALALHPQTAPKYANKAECEADFGVGGCETAPQQSAQGGSFFMPLMMGYLAGQMFNRSGNQFTGNGPQAGDNKTGTKNTAGNTATQTRSNVASQPLYKSGDDRATYRTANNTAVSRTTGPVKVNPSRIKPQAGRLVPRGGFGKQASFRANSFGG